MSERYYPNSTEAGAFFIASVLLAQGVWSIAFHIGAFGTVSTEHLFMILAASIAAVIAMFVIGHTEDGEDYFSWTGTLVLLLPLTWFVVEVFSYGNNDETLSLFRIILTATVLIISLPYILFLILASALPEVAEIHHPRLWYGLIGIGIVIAVLAYSVGNYHYYFLTCKDFGNNNVPENCFSEPFR